MKIEIESTSKIIHVNGVPARIWEGKTASGIQVHCFITRIAVKVKEDTFQFSKELQENKPPSPEIEGYPLRMIL